MATRGKVNPEARMSIMAHLKELRTRLAWSLVGIVVGAIGGWFLYDPVMAYITAPLHEMANSTTQINFPTIGSALDLKLRVSLWIGLLVSSPWWIYQLGAFIMPGLKRKERAYAFAFGAVGVILFASGAATGVFLVPRAVEVLQSFVPSDGVSLLQADAYVDFYLRLVLLFGVSFLIPEILVVLNFLGILSSGVMLKGWRWAVVVAFLFAAIANPLPSPWPMIVQGLVLMGLYLLAVLISWINERYRKYGRRLRPTKNQKNTDAPQSVPRVVPGAQVVPGAEVVPGVDTAPGMAPAAGTPSFITGVIVLAGGTAQRMGGVSKPDVVVGGKTLLSRALDEIRASAPMAHIVVVAPPQVAVPGDVIRVLEDPPLGGPAAGVAAGFAALRGLPDYRPDGLVALLTCDAPLAPRLYPELERAFFAAINRTDNLAAHPGIPTTTSFAGATPFVADRVGSSASQYLHGLYIAAALEQLLTAQVRDTSVRSLFGTLKLTGITDSSGIGMDVDTWEDAAALERTLTQLGEIL